MLKLTAWERNFLKIFELSAHISEHLERSTMILPQQPIPSQEKNSDKENSFLFWRAENYRLLAIIRNLFIEEGKKKKLIYPWDFHKTAKCLHCKIQSNQPEIWQASQAPYRAFLKNLIRCERPWTCPVCASKIQAERRKELKKLTAWTYSNGYQLALVTLTFPHYSDQGVSDLLIRFKKALRFFKTGRESQTFRKRLGEKGSVRALEVNFSPKNGWHIHTHDLILVPFPSPIPLPEIENHYLTRWKQACEKNALKPRGIDYTYPATYKDYLSASIAMTLTQEEKDRYIWSGFLEHAVQITMPCHDSEYLAKSWGIEQEMTSMQSKHGSTGMTPRSLIENGYYREFLEFVEAFKNTRQLYWSAGLKKLAGKEKTDSEIVQEDDPVDLLATLSDDDWKIVLKHNLHARLLERAELAGDAGIEHLLEHYRSRT